MGKIGDLMTDISTLNRVKKMKRESAERLRGKMEKAREEIVGLALEMDEEESIYFISTFGKKFFVFIPYFEGGYSLDNMLTVCFLPTKKVFILTKNPANVKYVFEYQEDANRSDKGWIITTRQ